MKGAFLPAFLRALGLAGIAGALLSPHSAASAPLSDFTHFVPMRDKVALATDIMLPLSKGRGPVIVEMTPYGRGPEAQNFRNEAAYWKAHGYAFVIADVRGTGASGGQPEWFGKAQAQDGYDLIEWIARQPWSNGRIAMRGSSYTGTNQWFIARERPPHLRCITPSASLDRPMRDSPYTGGAFSPGWAINWIGHDLDAARAAITPLIRPDSRSWLGHRPLASLDEFAVGRVLPLYRQLLAHPTVDAYWRERDMTARDFAKIRIPSLAFTGWFDGTMAGTIWHFEQAQRYSKAGRDQFLVVGPYSHTNAPDGGYDFSTGMPMPMVGDLPVPAAGLLPGREMTRRFYDWCLKGASRPLWPSARAFVTGADQWIEGTHWPVRPAKMTPLYLGADGVLAWGKPKESGADRHVHDSSHPISSIIPDKSFGLPIDVTPLFDRGDALVYTSAPLSHASTILGDVKVVIDFATTARDADVVVQFMDVFPDGRSIKLGSKTAGQLRLRYRMGWGREVPMIPGRRERVTVDLRAIGYRLERGHRIRLWVAGSFYPWMSVNPGTGNPIADDIATPIVSRHTIYRGGNTASHILLPILKP